MRDLVDISSFRGRDIISMQDFNRSELEFILDKSDEMPSLAREGSDLLRGRILATLFFEPSTRTRLSFESAMLRLGGGVIGFAEPKVSSVAKGETLSDTVKVVESYSDAIVLRHPTDNAAKVAANAASVPVINAGSGSWEHPTQALLDLHTIRTAKGKIDGLRIALLGDLLYGRTVHSLVYALSNFNVNLYLISPKQLRMRREILSEVKDRMEYVETSDVTAVLPELDVLYVTRVQKERFSSPAQYDEVKDAYMIDRRFLEAANSDLAVMHPLPRLTEIAKDVDETPHALYFKQVSHGVYVRMALLLLILCAL